MVRTVICESYLEDYLKNLRKTNEISVGLLVGQPSKQGKDYIVHLNRIKPENEVEIESLDNYDVGHLAHHALSETRMLPGGMYILGIFIISPQNVFEVNPLAKKVKKILSCISHVLNEHGLLFGNCHEYLSNEKLVLFYSSSDSKHECRAMNLTNDTANPVDWKFQAKPTCWQLMETYFEHDDVCLYSKKKQNDNIADNLTKSVERISQQLKKSILFVDGEPVELSDTVEKILEMKKENVSHVNLYLPCPKNTSDAEINITKYAATVQYSGVISSRIYVHHKNTMKDVENFIREDIIRSLFSRVEVHCDALVETEDTIVMNELPRRIYFPINRKSTNIEFSDYLFREETKNTAIQQAKDILDLNLTLKDVCLNVEVHLDPHEESISHADIDESDSLKETGKSVMYTLGIIIAFVILMIAILIHFLIRK